MDENETFPRKKMASSSSEEKCLECERWRNETQTKINTDTNSLAVHTYYRHRQKASERAEYEL